MDPKRAQFEAHLINILHLDPEDRARQWRFVDNANKQIIPTELLAEIIRKIFALPQVTDSREEGTLRHQCLREVLGDKYLEDHFSDALWYRITALEALPARALYGWYPVDGSEAKFPHPEVIEAAATEPIILDSSRDARKVFDPQSFRSRLLQISKTAAVLKRR